MSRRRFRRLTLALLLALSLQTAVALSPAWAEPDRPCNRQNKGEWVIDDEHRIWECRRGRWIQIGEVRAAAPERTLQSVA